jgi:hypothetical protein
MSELANYIIFTDGVEKWLTLTNPRILTKSLVDPLDKQRKEVKTRRWTVTREDRNLVNKVLDVTSGKLDTQLMQLWSLGTMQDSDIGITMHGEGFDRQYTITTRTFQY